MSQNGKSNDILETIFDMQKKLAQVVDSSRYPDSKEQRVSALCTAMIHEVIELQRLTNWKWWKKPTTFDQDSAREELIDIWHFLIQTSLEMGLEPKDILDEYIKKNAINHKRQKDSY